MLKSQARAGFMGDKPGTRIGRNLDAIQRRLGVRDADLARATGISQGYFTRLKKGEIDEPGYTTLISIASALGVPLAVLVEGATVDVAAVLPAANVYLREKYGLTDSFFIRVLDNFAKVLAQEQNEHGSLAKDSGGRSSMGTGGAKNIAYRLFERMVDRMAEEAGYGGAEEPPREADPQLAGIVAAWSKMSEEQRKTVHALIRMLAGTE
jgi:transcriptional regulator with XRE-family HTH domain